MLNPNHLAHEIVAKLRGNRSSSWLSKKMGFKSNVVYRWETGKTEPSWTQFLHYCEWTDRTFLGDFKNFFRISCPLDETGQLLNCLAREIPASQMAARLSVSKSTVSRLFSGNLEPSLSTVLSIVLCSGGQLATFLGQRKKMMEIPEVAQALNVARVFFDHPEAIIIWNLVDLHSYRTSSQPDQWLAQATGWSAEKLQKLLTDLEFVHALQKTKSHHWQACALPVCLRGTREQEQLVEKFWLSRALQSVEQNPSQDLPNLNYRIFTTDERGMQEIKSAIQDFSHRIGHIIEESQSRPQKQILTLLNCLLSPID